MTFGEVSWLLFGAVIGVTTAYAIPYGMTLIARLMRPRKSTATALSTPAPDGVSDAPKPRISDEDLSS